MRHFNELTPGGQARRIRSAMIPALKEWGIHKADVRFIHHGENTTFKVKTRRGAFLARMHREGYNLPEDIVAELAWLDALDSEEPGLAPQAVRTQAGDSMVIVESDGMPTRRLTLLRWVEGRLVGKRISPVYFRQLGGLISRLQKQAHNYRLPKGLKRRRWDFDGHFGSHEHLVSTQKIWKLLPTSTRKAFRAVAEHVRGAMDDMGEGRDAFGLIHADLHSWNVVRSKAGLHAIDFDDCGYAHWITDLATALHQWHAKPGHESRRDALLAGYADEGDLALKQEQHLEAMMAARSVSIGLWVAGRAQTHAGMRKIMPDYLKRVTAHCCEFMKKA